MRPVLDALVSFVLFAALTGPIAGACAADATLFYAPPTQTAVPTALVVEKRRQIAKRADRPEPPRGRVCFNAEETRDQVAALRLAEPFRAIRVGRLQGEALRAKLCRWRADELVYEIAVLRRDGRIVHVYMNAQSGKDVRP